MGLYTEADGEDEHVNFWDKIVDFYVFKSVIISDISEGYCQKRKVNQDCNSA